MRRTILSAVLAGLAVLPAAGIAARADRAVAWTMAGEAALERELNNQAARGLRVAAVSDGLPCTVTVLQGTEQPAPAAAYRVVADRDLEAMLGSLIAEGFMPRLAHRRVTGRAHVIFERAGAARPASASTAASASVWRLVEFADLNAMQPALAAAAGDGFQARMLVRHPLKSWPGLSEKGLLAEAASRGFSFDLLFTGGRDGSREARRERLLVLMSRESGASTKAPQVRLERASSFGTFGSGVPLGAAPSIVGLAARKLLNGAYELVYITDQRMGG